MGNRQRTDLLHGGLGSRQQLRGGHHAVHQAQLQRLLRAGQLGKLQELPRWTRACMREAVCISRCCPRDDRRLGQDMCALPCNESHVAPQMSITLVRGRRLCALHLHGREQARQSAVATA